MMKLPDSETIKKYILIVPAIREDLGLKKEIEEYVRFIKNHPNPQWDYCLDVLKKEYKPIGLLSHAASYSAAEEIKMEKARRILKPMIEKEFRLLSPEKVSVKQ